MSAQENTAPRDIFDFPGNGPLFAGVLSRRILAFALDLCLIGVLVSLSTLVLFVLSLPTLGLSLLILAPTAFGIILAYIAFSVGGANSATPGMHALGLHMRATSGRKPSRLIALLHALVFYFSVTTLTPFILLLGLFSKRQRLLHDYLVGVIVINRDPIADRILITNMQEPD